MNFTNRDISIINEYNKLRFILNTLDNLRYEFISSKNSSIENFEILNVIFILLKKLFSENENFEKKNQETSILFLNRKDVLVYLNESNLSADVLKNNIEKTLLEKLEKDLKSIIDKKNKLIISVRKGIREII